MRGGLADDYGTTEAAYGEQLLCERKSLGEGTAGVAFLDPAPYFLKAGRVRALEGSTPLYTDGSHLSIAGVQLLRPMFERVLASP
jgi:lysophospholipase L1-like esterase